MFPALLPGTNSMVQYSHILDTSGTVAIAQALKRMKYPWSLNVMSNAPYGENFWSLNRLVQAVQWLALWLLTRFNSAILSVNILICIGWVLSGISVYILCRFLKLSVMSSVMSGLLVQMLPWVREKVMTHVAYVFICIPIFAIILLLKTKSDPNRSNFIKLFGFICFTAFFDLYWFYINVLVASIFVFFSHRTIIIKLRSYSFKARIAFTLIPPTIIVVLIWIYRYLLRITSSGNSLNRPFSIATDEFIDLYNGSLLRYVRPTIGHLFIENGLISSPVFSEDYVLYVGVVTLFLAIGSFISRIKLPEVERGHLKLLALIAIVCALMTIPAQMKTQFGVIPGPAHFVKFLTPGMRVYSRFGLVTESLICVLAGYMLGMLQTLRVRNAFKYFLLAFVIVFSFLDMNPFARRLINDEYAGYAKVREVLNSTEQPVLLELPPDLDKLYFASSYSDAPHLLTAKNRYWDEGLWRNAELGDYAFASYLASRQVTHILVPVNEDETISYRRKWGVRPSVNLTFPDELFTEVARISGFFPAVLLELDHFVGIELCKGCSEVTIQWENVRASFYSQNFIDGRKSYEDGAGLSWVYPNELPTLRVVNSNQDYATYEVRISLVAAYGANAQTQLIQVEAMGQIQTITLTAGPAKDVVVTVLTNAPIRLRSFMPCTVPSILEPGNQDTRKLCYGVSDIEVVEVVHSTN
jgi:hypothetical protein